MCCDKSSEHVWDLHISSTLNHQVLEFTLPIFMHVAICFPPACPVPDMLSTSCIFLLSLLIKQVGLTSQLLPCPCAVLCCAVLCCAVLCCAVLCCAVLCCYATNSDAELGIGGEGG